MKFIKIAAISFLAGNTVDGGKCMRMRMRMKFRACTCIIYHFVRCSIIVTHCCFGFADPTHTHDLFYFFTILPAALPEVSEACTSAFGTFEACATEGLSKDMDLFMNYLKTFGEAAGCFEAAADEAAIAVCAEPVFLILAEACPSGVDPLIAACDETPSTVFEDLGLDVFDDIAGNVNVKDGELLMCFAFCVLVGRYSLSLSLPLRLYPIDILLTSPYSSFHFHVSTRLCVCSLMFLISCLLGRRRETLVLEGIR